MSLSAVYGDIIILKLATNSSTLGDVSDKEKPQGHGSMKGKERKARLAKKKKGKEVFISYLSRDLCAPSLGSRVPTSNGLTLCDNEGPRHTIACVRRVCWNLLLAFLLFWHFAIYIFGHNAWTVAGLRSWSVRF